MMGAPWPPMKTYLNAQMLWGAALGWLILGAAGELLRVSRHDGPGVVWYGDGEHSPERSEQVSEWQYKRHHGASPALLLMVGLTVWFFVARSAAAKEAAASIP